MSYIGDVLGSNDVDDALRSIDRWVMHVAGKMRPDLHHADWLDVQDDVFYAVMLWTLREFLLERGMLFVSGDFHVQSAADEDQSQTISGFSRLEGEPGKTSIVNDGILSSLQWWHTMYFDNTDDSVTSMTSRTGSATDHALLVLTPDNSLYAFIEAQTLDELVHDVYHVELDDVRRTRNIDVSSGGARYKVLVELNLGTIVALYIDSMVRRGLSDPMRLFTGRNTEPGGPEIFMSLKRYARHSRVFGREEISTLEFACAMMYIIMLRHSYANERHLIHPLTGLYYEKWVDILFCITRDSDDLHNTVGDYRLMKTKQLENIMLSEYLYWRENRHRMTNLEIYEIALLCNELYTTFHSHLVADDRATEVSDDDGGDRVPTGESPLHDTDVVAYHSGGKLPQWSFQLKLPYMDVHEFFRRYVMVAMYDLIQDGMDVDYMALWQYASDDPDAQHDLENLVPLDQDQKDMLQEDVPDFSGEEFEITDCEQSAELLENASRRFMQIAEHLNQ